MVSLLNVVVDGREALSSHHTKSKYSFPPSKVTCHAPRASLSSRRSSHRGLHLHPLPILFAPVPQGSPFQVVSPLGDGLVSRSGLARLGPVRSNPATRRSQMSPDPRTGSGMGPQLRCTGQRYMTRCNSPFEGV
ncbi:hypothetical protein ILYODFUR_010604 [Ilyodon furcidens]|uniref:Uncharacterized protein n=1 Tax=Ilyodon furcidens TaxID=33524 RepID=A0ABV0U489_9TELE